MIIRILIVTISISIFACTKQGNPKQNDQELLCNNKESLYPAIMSGQIECVKKTIASGVDLKSPSSEEGATIGDEALELAVRYNKKDIARFLLMKGVRPVPNNNTYIKSAITAAAINSDEEMLKLLIKFGARANNASGTLALCWASDSGNINIAKLLIKIGANINSQLNKEEPTPLICAIQAENIELVKLLIKNGANINMGYNFVIEEYPNGIYLTPLEVANKWKRFEIVELLKNLHKK